MEHFWRNSFNSAHHPSPVVWNSVPSSAGFPISPASFPSSSPMSPSLPSSSGLTHPHGGVSVNESDSSMPDWEMSVEEKFDETGSSSPAFSLGNAASSAFDSDSLPDYEMSVEAEFDYSHSTSASAWSVPSADGVSDSQVLADETGDSPSDASESHPSWDSNSNDPAQDDWESGSGDAQSEESSDSLAVSRSGWGDDSNAGSYSFDAWGSGPDENSGTDSGWGSSSAPSPVENPGLRQHRVQCLVESFQMFRSQIHGFWNAFLQGSCRNLGHLTPRQFFSEALKEIDQILTSLCWNRPSPETPEGFEEGFQSFMTRLDELYGLVPQRCCIDLVNALKTVFLCGLYREILNSSPGINFSNSLRFDEEDGCILPALREGAVVLVPTLFSGEAAS